MIEEKEYSIIKLGKKNLFELRKAREILFLCGKDMAKKYGLYHWDNSYFKSWIVILISILKNEIYIIKKNNESVATFQVKKVEECLYFFKLATKPQYMGKGIGKFCIREIEKIAQKFNCKYVMCEVYDKSSHAIKFYKNNGYIIFGNKETLKYNELKMRKEL